MADKVFLYEQAGEKVMMPPSPGRRFVCLSLSQTDCPIGFPVMRQSAGVIVFHRSFQGAGEKRSLPALTAGFTNSTGRYSLRSFLLQGFSVKPTLKRGGHPSKTSSPSFVLRLSLFRSLFSATFPPNEIPLPPLHTSDVSSDINNRHRPNQRSGFG